MKKKRYIKPQIEDYRYSPENGYGQSVALYTDYLLVEGNDRSTLRAADEVTEYTDNNGEYEQGLWY